jgi:Arm DNA-binding domain
VTQRLGVVLSRIKDTKFGFTSHCNCWQISIFSAFGLSILDKYLFGDYVVVRDPSVTQKTACDPNMADDDKITMATVKSAVARAAKGEEYEMTDPQCPGLQLRVRGGAVTFTVRSRLFGVQKRWIVGDAETKPDVARERAGEVKGWCRRGQDPEKLVTQFTTGISIAYQVRVAGERPPPSWSWQKAVDKFMEHILSLRSGSTYDDYARTIGGKNRSDPNKRHAIVPELKRFVGRDVAAIGREEIAETVAEVCKRKHRLGVHLKSVLGSMWSFLGDDSRRRETSVPANLLLRLKAPEQPSVLRGDPALLDALGLFNDDDEDSRRDVPTPLAMGRAVAIARSGGMMERAALSVLLLAGSLQRRRAVIGSHRADFHMIGDGSDKNAGVVWAIPPYMRKRSNKRRAHLNHDVVLVGFAALAERRLDNLAVDQGYYFPVRPVRGKKTKNPHADPGFINHALQYMPGVDMSCHSWRRGFASHGQRELGFALEDIKLILDHSEGAPPGDVTAGNYALDPMIAKKREIMLKWLGWLELQVEAAIAEDPSLLDAEAVGGAIFRARYGVERWEQRLARTQKHGVGVLDYPFAGKKKKKPLMNLHVSQ